MASGSSTASSRKRNMTLSTSFGLVATLRTKTNSKIPANLLHNEGEQEQSQE